MAAPIAPLLVACASMIQLRKRFSAWLAPALSLRRRQPQSRPHDNGIRCATRSAAISKPRRFAVDRAFRRYDAADPANRLVAGELEVRGNRSLARVAEVEGKIAAHDAAAAPPVVDPSTLGVIASNQNSLGGADNRCTTEETHCAHVNLRGRGRYRRRSVRDRSHGPLGRRSPQRDEAA